MGIVDALGSEITFKFCINSVSDHIHEITNKCCSCLKE